MHLLLSCLLFWILNTLYRFIGGIVVIYRLWRVPKLFPILLQMSIIFCGLFGRNYVVHLLGNIGFGKAISIAGKMGRTNAIEFKFTGITPYRLEWINRWFSSSYLTSNRSGQVAVPWCIGQRKTGLLMNGLVKYQCSFTDRAFRWFTFIRYKPWYSSVLSSNKLEKSNMQLNQLNKDYEKAFEENKPS
ncbi:hypothetical protein CS542_01090 [Pedobacter sp. IW39]|nr:hypothetical protein CS542_01090 [Pedobacter sp. IW39]